LAQNSLFQRIFLPGLLFQSVIIGGGYATGRELVEFFLSAGPLAGVYGMCLAAAGFSLVAAISFELARVSRSYDYRSFFKQLLGPAWFLFEIAYLVLGILVIAVIGAAAGEVVAQHFGMNSFIGTLGLMILIAVLVFWGTRLIEKVLAAWSFVLYAVYAIFVVLYLLQFGDRLPAVFAADPVNPGWLVGSLKYVGYSMAAIPIILFCVKHMQSRSDALVSGLLAGPLGMLPALMFYLAMVAEYPDIQSAPVPADYLMQQLHLPLLKSLFYLVMFGTFVETGTAFIHAINERISGAYAERSREMPQWLRPVIGLAGLLLSIWLATQIGLIDLIASGYGTLTWAIIVIYLVPLFTVGLYRIVFSQKNHPGAVSP
jgi:uncharacterized membrane protein YkvI